MRILFQKIHPAAKLPSYAYKGDAGMDLFSCVDYEVGPGQKGIVPTGFKIAVPQGHAGFIWDKSGIAVKNHIKTMAGVLDSNYRGELRVVLTNLGKEPYSIKKGQKIAQLVIKPVVAAEIMEVEELGEDTVRGEKGFGSSGV